MSHGQRKDLVQTIPAQHRQHATAAVAQQGRRASHLSDISQFGVRKTGCGESSKPGGESITIAGQSEGLSRPLDYFLGQ